VSVALLGGEMGVWAPDAAKPAKGTPPDSDAVLTWRLEEELAMLGEGERGRSCELVARYAAGCAEPARPRASGEKAAGRDGGDSAE
jgi:hypothetical protein